MSKEFVVNRPELHLSRVKIVAETAEEAIQRVKDGDGEEIGCDYDCTLAEPRSTEED